jgi:hypothetical protein
MRLIWISLLSCAVAWGESAEHRHQLPDTVDRISGVTTFIPMGKGGLVTLGGSNLRVLMPGARRFESLHVVKGDNLYRVATTPGGAVLAAWENDGLVHYFSAPPRRHVTLAIPPGPPKMGRWGVEFLGFLPGEREIVVHLDGPQPPNFKRGFDRVYKMALDGQTPPELLYEVDSGRELHRTLDYAIYVMPERPGQDCELRTCYPVASIDLYQGTSKRTLLSGSGRQISNANIIWGADPSLVVLRVDYRDGGRDLLWWRSGEAPVLHPLPGRFDYSEEYYVTRSGEVLQLVMEYRKELRIRRLFPDGREKMTVIPAPSERHQWNQTVYDVGQRRDGRIYLHWGDRLLLFGDDLDQQPRAFEIETVLERKTEWSGATVYQPEPESLWVGLDGRGRNFVRVSFQRADKGAKPWAPRPKKVSQ